LPKVGLVDDIAEAALFLASDAARLINGHNLIIIDGGITADGRPRLRARTCSGFGPDFGLR
jgi:NAD(P)-dependent dehydrogenase (short-subunit alcohol dehydrogenase family)